MLPRRPTIRQILKLKQNTKNHSLVLKQIPLRPRIPQRSHPSNNPNPQRPPPFPSNRNSSINNSPHNPFQDRLFPRRDLVTGYVRNGITVVIQERATDCGAICCIAFDDGEVRDGRRNARGAMWSDHCRELSGGADQGDDGVVVREEGREEARAKVAGRTEEEEGGEEDAVWLGGGVHFF